MFFSLGLHKTVVTFVTVCAHTLQGKLCFSPNSSLCRHRSPGLCCLQWCVRRSRGMDVCSGNSSQSPEASQCTALCLLLLQHHRGWDVLLPQNPQPSAGFWEGTDSDKNLEFQLRIKSEQPWFQPPQSVPWATPAWHKEGAQWHT